MATASQPLASPSNPIEFDHTMGSYNGNSFNAASYTMQFPLSWKAGSFSNRFHYPGSPSHQSAILDPNDFKCGKISSSIESDRGSLSNALHVFDRQDELCRNYTCCGLNLTDMHALVDHFEEAHFVPAHAYPQTLSHLTGQPAVSAVTPPISANSIANALIPPARPLAHPPYLAKDVFFLKSQAPPPHSISEVLPFQGGLLDPDDMELDLPSMAPSSCASSPSPPESPVPTPRYPYSHTLLPFPPYQSQPPSPRPTSHSHAGSRAMTPETGPTYPFNAYAGYSDYSSSMPGTVPSPTSHDDASVTVGGEDAGTTGNCVQPSALFSSTLNATASRIPSHMSTLPLRPSSPSSSILPSIIRRQPTVSAPSTTLSRPASTLLLSKPFRCPKSNCNKSYKQANGLKYHMTHGSCSLKPVREVEAVKVLLASKSAQQQQQQQQSNSMPGSPTIPGSPTSLQDGEYAVDGVEVTQADLLMLEKRIRPFACGIGDCQRRYKNMNGLRYHYSHSGEHGRKGLEMLAMGVHECLGGGTKSRSQSRGGSRAQSRAQTPPPLASALAGVPAYEAFEDGVTLQAPLQQQPQAPPSLLASPSSFAYRGMLYQAQPSSSSQPSSPSPPPSCALSSFTPFQTTSYTLAGAMGPTGTGGSTYAGNRDSSMIA